MTNNKIKNFLKSAAIAVPITLATISNLYGQSDEYKKQGIKDWNAYNNSKNKVTKVVENKTSTIEEQVKVEEPKVQNNKPQRQNNFLQTSDSVQVTSGKKYPAANIENILFGGDWNYSKFEHKTVTDLPPKSGESFEVKYVGDNFLFNIDGELYVNIKQIGKDNPPSMKERWLSTKFRTLYNLAGFNSTNPSEVAKYDSIIKQEISLNKGIPESEIDVKRTSDGWIEAILYTGKEKRKDVTTVTTELGNKYKGHILNLEEENYLTRQSTVTKITQGGKDLWDRVDRVEDEYSDLLAEIYNLKNENDDLNDSLDNKNRKLDEASKEIRKQTNNYITTRNKLEEFLAGMRLEVGGGINNKSQKFLSGDVGLPFGFEMGVDIYPKGQNSKLEKAVYSEKVPTMQDLTAISSSEWGKDKNEVDMNVYIAQRVVGPLKLGVGLGTRNLVRNSLTYFQTGAGDSIGVDRNSFKEQKITVGPVVKLDFDYGSISYNPQFAKGLRPEHNVSAKINLNVFSYGRNK